MVLSLFLEQSSKFCRDDSPDVEIKNGYCASLGHRVGWLGQCLNHRGSFGFSPLNSNSINVSSHIVLESTSDGKL